MRNVWESFAGYDNLSDEAKQYLCDIETDVANALDVAADIVSLIQKGIDSSGGNGIMGILLDRAAIFAASDIKTETVAVPEWGGDVRVRGLTGYERDDFESTILDQRGKKTKIDLRNARARLVALTVVDAKGVRLFSDDDVIGLGAKSAAALDRIYDVAARLSGISDDDVEELLGKDGKTTGGGSPSD